jgi:hypothetical protein
MELITSILGRQKKVTNQKLADDISKLCEELTSGIIELSNKANKINELKEKYKKSQSELENSSTNSNSATASPKASKGFFSWFGSNEDDDVPPPRPPPSNQPQFDVNSPTTENNIDADSLSAASTAQAIDPPAISQDITPQSPIKDSSSSDKFLSVGSDFSSSSDVTQKPLEQASLASPSSPSLQPAAEALASPASPASPSLQPAAEALASPALQSASAAEAPASSASPEPIVQDASTLSKEQPSNEQNTNKQDNSSIFGGKNRKKSKRSKQTIRKANKNSNRVTRKHKNNNNSVDKAKLQGLAQALLQAQGQA